MLTLATAVYIRLVLPNADQELKALMWAIALLCDLVITGMVIAVLLEIVGG